MEDKLQTFFSENDFDFQEPHSGHLERFERKLNQPNKAKSTSWKWLSVAASVVLVLGFWLGSNHQKKQLELADVSPKMEEVQNYFVSTIYNELKTVESNRSLETETIIEQALDELEELEEAYNVFLTELNVAGNQSKIINAMIKNYQKRLEILENVLKQIEQIKNPELLNDEIYI
jgi:cytoskeletal protein RodZ